MIEGIPAVLAGVGLLLLFMAAGMPVFVAFLTVNMGATLLVLGPAGFGMFSGSFYETATNSTLVTIPLFILMGELLFRSRAVDVLFQSIDTLIGRVPGRQYVLSIVLSDCLQHALRRGNGRGGYVGSLASARNDRARL